MSRYHIPFPSNYLSLNKPINKGTTNGSPTSEVAPHNFLSNRPAVVPRAASISSVSSSTSETPAATPLVASPVLATTTPAFLTLNRKHEAPLATTKEMMANPSSFLSNRR